MSSTASELLKLQIVDPGTEDDVWGTIKSNNVFRRLEQSGHGEAPITIAASSITLDDTAYQGTQSHKKILKLTGAQTASVSVNVPARTHVYYVLNNTTNGGGGPHTVTVKVSGQTGVALAHGEIAILYANGTDVQKVFSTTTYQPVNAKLTAIAALSAADGQFAVGNGTTFVGESGATARASLGIDGAAKVLQAGDYGDGSVGTNALANSGITYEKFANPIITRASAPPSLTNSLTDAEHDIDISSKWVELDNGSVVNVPTLTKRIDASWAVGTNQGGLDTGSVSPNTWYALWVIHRSDTGVTDAMFTTDASGAPSNLPTNYDDYRRIGWVLTDGSANIIGTRQIGDDVWWLSSIHDISTNPGSGTNFTVSTPPDVLGYFRFNVQESTSSDVSTGTLYPTWATSSWPSVAYAKAVSGGTGGGYGQVSVPVDSNSQIAAADTGSPNSFNVYTVGWTDRRGRDG